MSEWQDDWESKKKKAFAGFRLAKVEELLKAWISDKELCDKLMEIKMLLIERIKNYE